MPKRPTIKDVAKASGVSISTVDRVLNGRETVRAKTVIRVHEAAKTLGFPIETPPDPRAHDAPPLVFGLLLPPNDREFYEHLIAEAQRAAQDFTRARVRPERSARTAT